MTDNTVVVFHGFLNLSMREKMELVTAINEYFDSINREPIREANEKSFSEMNIGSAGKPCKCCGR